MKPAHRLYALLLITSIGITALAALPLGNFWTTVLHSIGCGGIASVGVTWLLSIRDFRALKKENAHKFACILEQYMCLFKRLLFVAVNECHGLCYDQTERPLRDWLTMLCDEKNNHGTSKSDTDMSRRCERLSGTIEEIQKFIERFQAQSASLILSGYPNIDEILRFFAVQHTHCWGILQQLESANYKGFCDTVELLYQEFLRMFPEYESSFPVIYNVHTFDQVDGFN